MSRISSARLEKIYESKVATTLCNRPTKTGLGLLGVKNAKHFAKTGQSNHKKGVSFCTETLLQGVLASFG